MQSHERLLAFASRWFDSATAATVFEPMLADWQREWRDAPPSRRRLIVVRGYAAFAMTALASAPRAVLFTPTPPAIARRVVSRIIIVTSVLSAVAMWPYLRDLTALAPAQAVTMLLWVLPSCVLFALPFAMVSVADGIRRHTLPNHVERATALRVGLATCIFMLAIGAWIVPAANQQFRVAMTVAMTAGQHQPPRRGVRELSTFELLATPQHATATEASVPAVARWRELNNRISLTLLPALLLWRRWRALDLPPGRWFSPLPVVLATVTVLCGYWFMRVSDRLVEAVWSLPPGTGPWVPVMAFAALGILRQRIARAPEARA